MESKFLGSLSELIGHMLVGRGRTQQTISIFLLVILAQRLLIPHYLHSSLDIPVALMPELCGIKRLEDLEVMALFPSGINRMHKVP